jgi:hypothetical protein
LSRRKKAGIALVIIGVLLPGALLLLVDEYSPYMNLAWNVRNMEVSLYDDLEMAYMNVGRFRETFPMYDDMSDGELAERLHRKYFGDMSLEAYTRLFMAPTSKGRSNVHKYAGKRDVLYIRGDFEPYTEMGIMEKTVLSGDAAKYGLYSATRHRLAFPYRYALGLGIALAAVGLMAMASSRRP